MRNIIYELIRKECESYQLIKLGLLPSVEYGVDMLLLPLYPGEKEHYFTDLESFTNWRREALTVFYEKVNYAGFLKKKQHSFLFKCVLSALKRRVINNCRAAYKEPTLDKELIVDEKDTLAFKLSDMIAIEQYKEELSELLTFGQPAQIESFYQRNCKRYYPIDLSGLLHRLRRDDPDFWITLNPLIERMAFFAIRKHPVSFLFTEDNLQNIVINTVLVLRDKLDEKPLESPLHFKRRINKMCEIKCLEEGRKIESIEKNCSDVDMVRYPLELEEDFVLIERGEVDRVIMGMDINNNYEVLLALIMVLRYEAEPFYSQLSKEKEEEMNAFLWRKIDKLSYEKISVKLNREVTLKELANLRKIVSRFQVYLVKRFKELLNDYQPNYKYENM